MAGKIVKGDPKMTSLLGKLEGEESGRVRFAQRRGLGPVIRLLRGDQGSDPPLRKPNPLHGGAPVKGALSWPDANRLFFLTSCQITWLSVKHLLLKGAVPARQYTAESSAKNQAVYGQVSNLSVDTRVTHMCAAARRAESKYKPHSITWQGGWALMPTCPWVVQDFCAMTELSDCS